MEEIWKDLVFEYNGEKFDYTGLYKISNFGRVYSYKRNKILSPNYNNSGYSQTYMTTPRKNIQTHRLVAIMFIENPLKKEQVNHIDYNTKNNHVSNLEWVTPKENAIHSRKDGRYQLLNENKKELVVKMYNEGKTKCEISRILGVSNQTIHRDLLRMGIKKIRGNYDNSKKHGIKKDEIKKMFELGYTNTQISKIINAPVDNVKYYKNNWLSNKL